jgi:hypothetical protein
MHEGFAVYDPATGDALAVCRDASTAGFLLAALRQSGQDEGERLRCDPWAVPAEIFEAE